MDDISLQVNEPGRIISMARDSAGAGVTGATLSLKLRRNSDGFFWNGTTFQSAATSVSMTETDSGNLPGVYHYDITPRIAFTGVVYITTATAGVTNDPFVGTVLVGSWLDNLDSEISSSATMDDINVIKSRLGTSILDNEFMRVRHLLGQILDYIKK